VALAGIMGGLNSEIFAGTRDVLLESAFFDPVTIRRGSKRLGLLTEASYRFERGADIEGVTTALKRAMSLISRLAGGSIASGVIDNYPKQYTPPDIGLRVTNIRVRPDQIGVAPELVLRERIRTIMVGLGFSEIITYSFISPDSADILDAEEGSPLRSFVQLLNPLTVEQSVMRTSLIPGLLGTVKNNVSHDEKDLRLFEWGKVFFQRGEDQQPHEKICLAAVMTGLYQQKTWVGDERSVDFFDIKGALEALLTGLGLEEIDFQGQTGLPGYDPEISAGVYGSGSLIGQVGRISPKVMEAYEMNEESAYIFEIDVGALLEKIPRTRAFRSFARFPAVYRDISLLVNQEIESAGIVEIIKQKGGDLLESVHVFDLYQGKKLNPFEKALAFRLCYRSKDGTLDGGEINQLHDSIIDKIRQKTGGKLREG